jgi:hypothetical protein
MQEHFGFNLELNNHGRTTMELYTLYDYSNIRFGASVLECV